MSTYCFSVQAAAEPGTLPRLLDVLALHGHVPDQCHAVLGGPRGDEMSVDLHLGGIDATDAALLAKRFGRTIAVSSVLYSEKRSCRVA